MPGRPNGSHFQGLQTAAGASQALPMSLVLAQQGL